MNHCQIVVTVAEDLSLAFLCANPVGYFDIDRLQAETNLEGAVAKCRIPLDVKGSGAEVRIDCQFGCSGDHGGRKEIAINTENAQKIFQCHAYECGFRSNLLTLTHGSPRAP